MLDDDLVKAIETLNRYAPYEGTEIGPYWSSLCDVADNVEHWDSEFGIALRKEILAQYSLFNEEFEILEEEETYTQKTISVCYKY
jgi:hypothetical protein